MCTCCAIVVVIIWTSVAGVVGSAVAVEMRLMALVGSVISVLYVILVHRKDFFSRQDYVEPR